MHRLSLSLAVESPCILVGFGEDACLLPIRFHPLENTLPILLRECEFAHAEIDYIDAVGGRNESLNATTYLREYCSEPAFRSIWRNEGGEAVAAEHCTH